jgi:DNA polymerase I
MKYIQYGKISEVEILILIKEKALNKQKIKKYYIDPTGIDKSKFIIIGLPYTDKDTCPAKFIRTQLEDSILPAIQELQIKTILIACPNYLKIFIKSTKKVGTYYNQVLDSKIENFEYLKFILVPNYQALFYNPLLKSKMILSLNTLKKCYLGTYTEVGKDIIKNAYYPETVEDIKETFKQLHSYDKLTCDIETYSLKFYKANIATIAFAINKHEGAAFSVDYGNSNKKNKAIKALLKTFIEEYTGKLIYHNAGYDMKVLVYELWMKNLIDYKGMLEGIKTITCNFDDTKLILYLATNNAVENKLSLKDASLEFAGDYAQDNIEDVTKIPIKDLLVYNLKDCLSTWFVKDKYYPIMKQDQQEELYKEHFKPTVATLLQTELCGIPIDLPRVKKVKKKLLKLKNKYINYFNTNTIIQTFHKEQLVLKAQKATEKAKQKVYTITDSVIADDFNPNSANQVRKLIYEYLGYTVIDRTKKSKEPATGAKTLKKVIKTITNPEHRKILDYLIKLGEVSILLSTFIPAFEEAQEISPGKWRFYGNINLGGTQSLRVSSSNPNLQNIPSNSTHAKLIKSCFVSDEDWLFLGSDFDSLEDKINTIQTKDPNKEKVYIDGFDGHSLRAYSYFDDEMDGIDPNSVESINSIEKLYTELRQKSKSPTFALTYLGTYYTLMTNCGFTEEKARYIEKQYHDLYKVADQWLADTLKKAETTGYVPLAFGGRIRTPLLAQTMGNFKRPYAAEKEARSAGNAATQSYCFLTIRAFNEFMRRVWNSPYKYDVFPALTIHDAIYLVVRNDINIVKWVNDNLIGCMVWQELDEIKHDKIKITSSLEIYYPSWANKIKIPNKASEDEIENICKET